MIVRKKMPDILAMLAPRVVDEPNVDAPEELTGKRLRAHMIERGIIRPRVHGIADDGATHTYDDTIDTRPCLRIGEILRGYRDAEMREHGMRWAS